MCWHRVWGQKYMICWFFSVCPTPRSTPLLSSLFRTLEGPPLWYLSPPFSGPPTSTEIQPPGDMGRYRRVSGAEIRYLLSSLFSSWPLFWQWLCFWGYHSWSSALLSGLWFAPWPCKHFSALCPFRFRRGHSFLLLINPVSLSLVCFLNCVYSL